jgi:predicted nucleic acid-binding protein
MAGKVFVDTNVLLRAVLVEMKQHHEVDLQMKRLIRDGAELWINGQVIREFIVQATHPRTLSAPLSIAQTVQEIETIRPLFQVADDTSAVRERLLTLLIEYPTQGKLVHDTNLVATMLVYQIDTLLTLNVKDFERFGGRINITTLKA